MCPRTSAGQERCHQARYQREIESLARIPHYIYIYIYMQIYLRLLVSRFGNNVVEGVDAVEVALRRVWAVYVADR